MKAGIHPDFNTEAKITCACGAVYTIGSTRDSVFVELCKACHPFYTGKQKIVDTARRLEKFETRAAAATAADETTFGHDAKLAKKAARAKKREDKQKAAEA